MFFRKSIPATVVFSLFCSLLLTGCDNVIDFFQESGKTESSMEERATSSEGMIVLTGLLDEQQRLIDEIGFARQTGNTELTTRSFNEVMRLEQQFQDGFDQYEPAMTRAEIRQISNRHSDIIDGLPRP